MKYFIFLLTICLSLIGCSSFDAAPNRGKSNNGGNEANQDDISNVMGTYQGTITVSGQSAVNFVLTIDETDGSSKVEGFNIAAGNKRPVKGFCKIENSEFVLTLNDPGDNKTDGSFVIRLEKSGSSYSGSGTWTGFKNGTKASIKLSSDLASDLTPQWVKDLPTPTVNIPNQYFNKDNGYPKSLNKPLKTSLTELFRQIPDSYNGKKTLLNFKNFFPSSIFYHFTWPEFNGLIIHYTETENDGGTCLIVYYPSNGTFIDIIVLEDGFWGGGSISAFKDEYNFDRISYTSDIEGGFINSVKYEKFNINESSGKISGKIVQKSDDSRKNADYTATYNKWKSILMSYK